MRITIQIDLDGGPPTVLTDMGTTPIAPSAVSSVGGPPWPAPTGSTEPGGTMSSAGEQSAGAAQLGERPTSSEAAEPTANQLTRAQTVGAFDGGPAPAAPPTDRTAPPPFTAPLPPAAVVAGITEALVGSAVPGDISAGPAPGALAPQDDGIVGEELAGQQEATERSEKPAENTPATVQKESGGRSKS